MVIVICILGCWAWLEGLGFDFGGLLLVGGFTLEALFWLLVWVFCFEPL